MEAMPGVGRVSEISEDFDFVFDNVFGYRGVSYDAVVTDEEE